MRHLLVLFTAAVSLVACGTDDDLFGEATSATGSGATTGSGASGAGSGNGGDGANTSGPGAGGPGPSSGGGPSGSSAGGAGNAGGSSSDGGGGSTAQGGAPADTGCSDGQREYFVDASTHAKIAGCDAGFNVAGVTTDASMQPACGRVSGDDSANPEGTGCSVEDACSDGWHVCESAEDVSTHSGTGECDPFAADTPLFYITRQSQTAEFAAQCTGGGVTNNIVGCGQGLGDEPADSCAPLDHRMRSDHCVPTANWYCGNGGTSVTEAEIVAKVGSGEGGVLCCKN